MAAKEKEIGRAAEKEKQQRSSDDRKVYQDYGTTLKIKYAHEIKNGNICIVIVVYYHHPLGPHHFFVFLYLMVYSGVQNFECSLKPLCIVK